MEVTGHDDNLAVLKSSTLDRDKELAGQGGIQVVAESTKKDEDDVYVF